MNISTKKDNLINMPHINIDNESILKMTGGKANKNNYLVMSSQSAACSLR